MSIVDEYGVGLTDEDGRRLVLETLDATEVKSVSGATTDVVGALIAKGYTQKQVAAVLKRSVRTIRRHWRKSRPGKPIPKLTPVTGIDPDWTPEVENWQDVSQVCPRCGSEQGPIKSGEPYVCLSCQRSGFDDQLEVDRAEDRRVRANEEAARRAERKAEADRLRARRAGKKAHRD